MTMTQRMRNRLIGAAVMDTAIIIGLLFWLLACTPKATGPAEAVFCADTTTADGVTCTTAVERG